MYVVCSTSKDASSSPKTAAVIRRDHGDGDRPPGVVARLCPAWTAGSDSTHESSSYTGRQVLGQAARVRSKLLVLRYHGKTRRLTLAWLRQPTGQLDRNGRGRSEASVAAAITTEGRGRHVWEQYQGEVVSPMGAILCLS